MKKAVIIGAGIGGLATAIRLTARGYQVRIFDQNNSPGGKLSEIHWNGFRWDTGPSLFTLPNLVDELFGLFPDYKTNFSYRKLDLICRYFYEDETVINAYNDIDKFADEIEFKTGIQKKHIYHFFKKSELIYKLTSPVFIFKSFHKISTFLSKDFFKALLHFCQLDVFRTMHQANKAYFKDKHIVQLFDRYATYNGSNPYKAPATLNVIPHLEHNIGAYFPTKGMYQIINELRNLMQFSTIRFYPNEPATKIVINKNKVRGVQTENDFYEADVVVSDIDINAIRKILPAKAIARKYSKQDLSTSAIIFYWAISKEFPDLDLHNILFSENYQREFDYLFNKKQLYHDPTTYLFISSKIVKSDAPAGMENWFVMINSPEKSAAAGNKNVQIARNYIIKKINKILKTNIEDYILHESYMDPEQIEKRTSSINGALYGPNSNNKMAAFSRHPNFSSKYKGLYFTGGSVHPGGGIPLCLASAKIVDHLVANQKFPM